MPPKLYHKKAADSELNFIKYFWGMVKRNLRENCNYTFSRLQENMPKALALVPVTLIRKWENRMKRWMDTYREGLSVQDTQAKVKKVQLLQVYLASSCFGAGSCCVISFLGLSID